MDKETLNKQSGHWEKTFASKPDMFGVEPSDAAKKAATLFKQEGKTEILELGCGQGRDTFFFAENGFQIHALDYCESGIIPLSEKVQASSLQASINPVCHDVRRPLPFRDETFDGCFSHMLYCMALTTKELRFLSSEIRRVLKPGGLNIFTARNTSDAHYGAGIHRGEDMYEMGGFIVHYLSKDKIRELAEGFEVVKIDEFEEGELPKKLFRATMRKK